MWTLEKLKDWARPALRYEELIKIARTAPSAKQAKNQALEFAKNGGLDEGIAKACRWLTIIRRDYGPAAQEEYISSAREAIAQGLKPKGEKMVNKDAPPRPDNEVHYFKDNGLYFKCSCGYDPNSIVDLAKHYVENYKCRNCGKDDLLVPDPGAYYEDAVTPTGAALLCGHCRK